MPAALFVRLTSDEIERARVAGKRRETAARAEGGRYYLGHDTTVGVPDRDINAAGAELSVAKATGLPWSAEFDEASAKGDVGRLEVRWTRFHTGCLVIRDRDPANAAYVFVTGTLAENDYAVRGWGMARNLKRVEFIRDPRGLGLPAYFIPSAALLPPLELVRAAARHLSRASGERLSA